MLRSLHMTNMQFQSQRICRTICSWESFLVPPEGVELHRDLMQFHNFEGDKVGDDFCFRDAMDEHNQSYITTNH